MFEKELKYNVKGHILTQYFSGVQRNIIGPMISAYVQHLMLPGSESLQAIQAKLRGLRVALSPFLLKKERDELSDENIEMQKPEELIETAVRIFFAVMDREIEDESVVV